MELRFRPTVWPGGPVPVPRVGEVTEVEREGQWLLLRLGGGVVEAPPELYLRQFRDTPADDVDALAEVCKLGLIRAWGHEPYRDLPFGDDPAWGQTLVELEDRLWPGAPRWYGDESQREAVAAFHPTAFPVHAAEVAYRVLAMQRATNHLLRHLDGKPVAPAWLNCRDELTAWENFRRVTSAALRDFHVRVDVEVLGQPRRDGDLEAGEPSVSLYSAGMLQLVNHLATRETVRICANETCRRPFVHQLGRSNYGGHRTTGTIYCSSGCARAQYQREKRRRDKAARGGVEG